MSDKNLGKQLTAELILAKTKASNLESIRNLNLWGNELEDLSILQKMPNLQVISLSVNKISSLRDFRHCNKLQQLYLRKNNISDLNEIKYLLKLPLLRVLWLQDNPCATIKNYRQIVIRHLNLGKLDNNPVMPQQKQATLNIKQTIFPYNQKQEQVPSPVKPKKQALFSKPQAVQKQQKKPEYKQRPSDSTAQMARNQNILMAVLSLMRELDQNSLEIVRREADKLSHGGGY